MEVMVLLDAGHGGIIEGSYQTPGKRYYDDDVQLAEGAYNRAVVHGIAARLHYNRVPVHIINPEAEDISLKARARRVNEIARRRKCVLLSVHHNAFEDNRVRGTEFFTSRGDTAADPIAEDMARQFALKFPKRKLRKSTIDPAKWSKEAGYYILKSTVCPAVLSEWAFMTNGCDRKYILNVQEQVDFFSGFRF